MKQLGFIAILLMAQSTLAQWLIPHPDVSHNEYNSYLLAHPQKKNYLEHLKKQGASPKNRQKLLEFVVQYKKLKDTSPQRSLLYLKKIQELSIKDSWSEQERKLIFWVFLQWAQIEEKAFVPAFNFSTEFNLEDYPQETFSEVFQNLFLEHKSTHSSLLWYPHGEYLKFTHLRVNGRLYKVQPDKAIALPLPPSHLKFLSVDHKPFTFQGVAQNLPSAPPLKPWVQGTCEKALAGGTPIESEFLFPKQCVTKASLDLKPTLIRKKILTFKKPVRLEKKWIWFGALLAGAYLIHQSQPQPQKVAPSSNVSISYDY